MVAGLAFGVLDVLAPLRLSLLGAGTFVIGATFLAAAAIEAGLSPLAAVRPANPLVPVRLSLAAGVVVSLLAPVLSPAGWLVALLIVGMPAYGSLYAPAAALLSAGAHRLGLNQGLAFGMTNLAWAAGQAVAAAGSGALAQATSDIVPYSLLATACLVTLIALLANRDRRHVMSKNGLDSLPARGRGHRTGELADRDRAERAATIVVGGGQGCGGGNGIG